MHQKLSTALQKLMAASEDCSLMVQHVLHMDVCFLVLPVKGTHSAAEKELMRDTRVPSTGLDGLTQYKIA